MIIGAWLFDPSAQDSTCWTLSTRVGWYRPEQSRMNALLHHAGGTSPDSDSIALVELIADFSLLLHIKNIFNVPGTRYTKSQHVIFLTAPEACSSLVEPRKEWDWLILSDAGISVGSYVQSFMSSISFQQNVSVTTSPFAGFLKCRIIQ